SYSAPPEIHPLSLHDALPIFLLSLNAYISMRWAGSALDDRAGDSQSGALSRARAKASTSDCAASVAARRERMTSACACSRARRADRKSTRLNSSHQIISYAVF